jgi:hypothetical protein
MLIVTLGPDRQVAERPKDRILTPNRRRKEFRREVMLPLSHPQNGMAS